jgi:hypothetical protein
MDWQEKDEGFLYQPFPLRMDAPVVEESTSSERRDFRGKLLEEGLLTSPFAASPFVLHQDSETGTMMSSALERRQQSNCDIDITSSRSRKDRANPKRGLPKNSTALASEGRREGDSRDGILICMESVHS